MYNFQPDSTVVHLKQILWSRVDIGGFRMHNVADLELVQPKTAAKVLPVCEVFD